MRSSRTDAPRGTLGMGLTSKAGAWALALDYRKMLVEIGLYTGGERETRGIAE